MTSEHGKPLTYQRGCRCSDCRKAVTIQMRSYRERRATGGGSTLVSISEARKHLMTLCRQGFSRRVIAQAAGVSRTMVGDILHRRVARVNPTVEDRILGTTIGDCRRVSAGNVPAAPSLRLLGEFQSAGFTARWIRNNLRIDVNHLTPTLRAQTAERIQRVHDECFWQDTNGFRVHCRCVANPEQIADRQAKRRERARKVAA